MNPDQWTATRFEKRWGNATELLIQGDILVVLSLRYFTIADSIRRPEVPLLSSLECRQ